MKKDLKITGMSFDGGHWSISFDFEGESFKVPIGGHVIFEDKLTYYIWDDFPSPQMIIKEIKD